MKHLGLFAAGVLFGTAGLKILSSKEAKTVYAHTTAAVLRAKDCVMQTVTTIREGADDIYADAKVYSLDLTPYGYDTKVENGTWAETYDVLISDIKSCTDPETRYALMHEAEDLLMSTGCIVPLYYYTDIYMLDSNIHGFFSNPLGYKYFMYCTIG